MKKIKNNYSGSNSKMDNVTSKEINSHLAKRRYKDFKMTTEKIIEEYHKGEYDKTMTFEEFRNNFTKKYVIKSTEKRNKKKNRLNHARNNSMLSSKKKKKNVAQLSEKWQQYYNNKNQGKS